MGLPSRKPIPQFLHRGHLESSWIIFEVVFAKQEKDVDWADSVTMNLNVGTTRSTASAFVAPNNGPQPQNPIMSKVQKFVCKGSAADRVFASVKQGAIVGGVRGAASGFIGGEIAEPLGGGIPGALLGGFLGGTLGAAGGVFTGSAIAFGCSVAGAYGAGG